MSQNRRQHYSKTEIGKIIKARMKERKISAIWMAGQMGCSRTNIYKIFDKHSIDTELLMKISLILGYDFFKPYSEELTNTLKKKG